MSDLERDPLIGNMRISGRNPPGIVRKSLVWLILYGLFLVLNTLPMGRDALQDPLIPLHLAGLGCLGAFLFSLLEFEIRSSEAWAISGAAFILTVLASNVAQKGIVLGIGWFFLIGWCSWVVVRGGPR